MLKYKLSILFFLITFGLAAQQSSYMFRVYLSDKGISSYRIDKPEEFLSDRAIERRAKQNIAVDVSDLPVSEEYISEVESKGCKVISKSKWMKTLSVHCADSLLIDELKAISFVDSVKFVWKGVVNSKYIPRKKDKKVRYAQGPVDPGYYGRTYKQIAAHNGIYLHEQGYRGEEMEIAVIDAGFNGYPENLLLSTANVSGWKDFVYGSGSIFENTSDHGTCVLSAMGTKASNEFVGSAPNAKYWLFRSEDTRSEFPIEEDYWIAAAEYADSLGVDLINTSLGYYKFDKPAQNYVYQQTDGKSMHITLGAEKAVSKGIFVVGSAGNEGNTSWKYITAPGDGETVFTVGAIRNDSVVAAFSSVGPTADGRIKPDAVGVGENTNLVNGQGKIILSNGTSFSAPIICGSIACLWQAFPNLTNLQIADIVRQSSHKYSVPDDKFGYGIPDMKKAMEIAQNLLSITPEISLPDIQIKIKGDTTTGCLSVIKDEDDQQKCDVKVYTVEGKTVLTDSFTIAEKEYRVGNGSRKIYLIRLNYKDKVKTQKVFL